MHDDELVVASNSGDDNGKQSSSIENDLLILEFEMELHAILSQEDSGEEKKIFEYCFPFDVLCNIFSFVRVGRVCKTWKNAMDSLLREKFRKALVEVLQPYSDNAITIELCSMIEVELHEVCKNRINRFYHRKARQLLFNLKDIKNHVLRSRLISGEISIQSLVKMNASEMANPQLAQQRKEWLKKRKHEVTRALPDIAGFTDTDMFTCSSCGSKRARYCQWRRKAIVDRVRIVIVCNECTNRWEL